MSSLSKTIIITLATQVKTNNQAQTSKDADRVFWFLFSEEISVGILKIWQWAPFRETASVNYWLIPSLQKEQHCWS